MKRRRRKIEDWDIQTVVRIQTCIPDIGLSVAVSGPLKQSKITCDSFSPTKDKVNTKLLHGESSNRSPLVILSVI